ncbi:MAG: hypothetical protein KatS3mg105_4569 [Gemmatales bacterium]|nr:MAG: hypothetical protein KatS3mg105_4569 [Gemmatales bacterium]
MRNNMVFLGLALAGLLLGGGYFLHRGPAQPPAEAGKSQIIDAARFPDLQAAFDAVPDSGGLVKLPPGIFKLKKPLLLAREDVRIEGSGTATHLINENEEGQPALIIRAKDSPTKKRTRIWRVQLADFRISGNPKSGDGLRVEGVNELYISGLAIDHNGGHGINLIDCYEDPRISDSILTYNRLAGLNIVGGHDIVVNANQFEENQDAVRCIDSFNLCMNGNNLDDHLRHGVVVENTYGSVIAGNMIEECQGTAIILDRDCYGITISANVIAHNFGGGVALLDAWGCAVSANTFTIVAERGVFVGPNSGRITITGNSFSNSYIGGKLRRGQKDEATGIILEGASDIAITGNGFTGLTHHAVHADDRCRRIVVVGNVMADLGTAVGGKVSAVELGKAAESILKNNAIEEKAQK